LKRRIAGLLLDLRPQLHCDRHEVLVVRGVVAHVRLQLARPANVILLLVLLAGVILLWPALCLASEVVPMVQVVLQLEPPVPLDQAGVVG
jgi:hypothetical protein